MKPARLLPLLAALALSSSLPAREVHRCVTDDGALRFGDTPCPAAAGAQSTVTLADPSPEQRRRAQADAATRARSYADGEARRIAALDAASASRLPVSLGGAERTARTNVIAPARSGRAAESNRDPRQRAQPRPVSKAGEARACDAARTRRERAYREHGNDMGFDARRRLQDALAAACHS